MTTDDELLQRFRPIFDEIAVGAAAREREGRLALAEVAALRKAGFGAVRVPVARGGHGASIRQLLRLLVELGRADSNLPQALRQHFYQVELLLRDPDRAVADPWIERVAQGDLFGSGTSEPRGSLLGKISTVVAPAADGTLRLNGRKIYGTGNAYSQWIPVAAVDEHDVATTVVVPSDRDGVTIHEDWNGFGQRLTATSTVTFENVLVAPTDIRQASGSPDGPSRGGSGLHQAVLLAALAGVTGAAADDLAAQVRAKTRIYFTGTGQLPRHDAVVQEQVGRARAAADSAAMLVDGIGASLEAAWQKWVDPSATATEVDDAFIGVELAVSSVQVILSELALDTTAHLLDVLGASSLDRNLGLDRHWRNARALASHNPYPFKARLLGDHVLNGAVPPEFAAGRDVGDRASEQDQTQQPQHS